MMIHHFSRWRFLIMAQDEKTGQKDRVGKKWNLAANYLAKGYCHCVLKMRKIKWQKSRRKWYQWCVGYAQWFICPQVVKEGLEDCSDCPCIMAERGRWAACRRKLVAVYSEVNFKPMSEMLDSHPCLQASGRSNLGLFTGRAPHLCSPATCWPVKGHIKANLQVCPYART